MLNKKFSPERQSAFEARFEAQKIAFGPVVFQCVRYAWKRGMLQAIADAGETGLSVDELAGTGKWTAYALKMVLETCLSAGVVYLIDGRYSLDKAGFVVLTDPITQINIDFTHDVCYEGMFKFEQSLDAEKPLGLKVFGEWPTVYEGLSQLPEPARSSWFAFDHFYSDTSFPDIMPDVFATAPKRVMDIGANTGKFTLAALGANAGVKLHLVDLPGQLAVAEKALQEAGLRERASLHPTNLLDHAATLPEGMDLIWMSQFLSCFSEEAIASIFRRVAAALAPNGQVLVMDTFWDRQRYDIASYCLINTSPYFNNIASGNSKVYESEDYVRLAKAAGLELVTARDNIGYCHSLLRFSKAG
ncbi:class I SAM-dependent methyltransferase [Massilia sp. Dwa41.01b]|uniref:SAM-dependent methyltransferase n=1 Tax=unclassified Massilia TaxID=2609279 RepID=UPI0016048058|nr:MULTISPECIES: class I SAM-dependent methyltransferase [unclassified Massilia]QNA89426.1 class I SAM-dependent methyltransferase [Massilia sp. Dwa41.01b]QNB00327.1 class I SAM-dependent methyltransferase [Massilia sp. Se16.2.3]